ncbi:MAG: DUF3747 domain-containing protein [Synechococcaceae cyanobacterium]
MLPPAMHRSPALAVLAALGISAVAAGAPQQPVRAASLFQAVELDEQRLVLVAAPIGSTGTRAQLHIYEQLNDRRPCYAVNGGQPAQVDPLLSTFDFTGICSRYLDANGYSLRIGGSDLGTIYRLSVVRVNDDNLLLAVPTRPGAGPEMVVARTKGPGTDYLQLVLEPGWRLKRRAYNGRNLGHVYFYQENWPGADAAAAAPPAEPAEQALPDAGDASEAGSSGEAAGPQKLDVQLGSDALINKQALPGD